MDLPGKKLYEKGPKNGHKKVQKKGLGKKIFYSINRGRWEDPS